LRFLVVHGPNLNLLGTRELSVYGSSTLDDVNRGIQEEAGRLGVEVDIHQTQREGEIIELLHAGIDAVNGAVLNPAAYSHTSRAVADALRSVPYPVVEVHLSNIHAREEWRRTSVTAEAVSGIIAGFGSTSYVLALQALKKIVEDR
jgi:3-dehydroquinate dehydratase II